MTIELPSQAVQTEYNLCRWAEILEDRDLAKVEGRIETNRHGQAIMSPPPAPSHGRFQSRIAHLLQTLMSEGEAITECPISTADGVKAADVAWASPESLRYLGRGVFFSRSPEICVEILSPRNSTMEIEEKKTLYFDAGALEVWICSESGAMSFFATGTGEIKASKLCADFPKKVQLGMRNQG